MKILGIILLALVGALVYRWRGMNENDVPKFLKSRLVRRLLVCFIISVGLFFAGVTWYLSLIGGLLAFLGVIVGHGSYFSRPGTNIDNEVFKVITKLIADPLNSQARFIGMSLTGLTLTIPVAIFAGFFGIPVFVAILYGLCGILKGVIYYFIKHTETSEIIWGAVLATALPILTL